MSIDLGRRGMSPRDMRDRIFVLNDMITRIDSGDMVYAGGPSLTQQRRGEFVAEIASIKRELEARRRR